MTGLFIVYDSEGVSMLVVLRMYTATHKHTNILGLNQSSFNFVFLLVEGFFFVSSLVVDAV